ncbi:MAG: TAXI family TRAP transporter solute-binding subunit [Saprospiraceae bacterium]
MSKTQNINKLIIGALLLIFATLVLYSAKKYFSKHEVQVLKIGAGSKSGEAYQFAQAIAEVMNRYHPEVKIEVLVTAGSSENMKLLEAGQIDLATVQADIEAVPSARIVSNLYPDMFQLIVRKDANIETFKDLKGKRMALPSEGGGQWVSFWNTANHYDVYKDDIKNIALSGSAATDAFIKGEIDAIFKVRAPRNGTIGRLLNSVPSMLVPIEQAPAMKIKQPSLDTGIIPSGTYSGNPLIPANDLITVAVNRLLVANVTADDEAVKLITQILFERRMELLKTTPLAGFISQPDWNAGTFIPVHKGSQSFFEREKPSYFVQNADFLALLISLILMGGSALIGLRKHLSGKQKNLADKHTLELVSVLDEIKDVNSLEQLSYHKDKMSTMLGNVVKELDNDALTVEGFQFFSFTWNSLNEMIKDKERELRNN